MNLVKVENNELVNKLRYLFVKNNGDSWKMKYTALCAVKGVAPIAQGELSDYEYYLKIHPLKADSENISHYYLVDDDEPVTYITLTKDEDDVVDITYTTAKKHVGKGYATMAVMMLEQMLFADSTVKGIKLLDQLSTGGATTKIATKLGFERISDAYLFVKYNQNYKPKNQEEKTPSLP